MNGSDDVLWPPAGRWLGARLAVECRVLVGPCEVVRPAARVLGARERKRHRGRRVRREWRTTPYMNGRFPYVKTLLVLFEPRKTLGRRAPDRKEPSLLLSSPSHPRPPPQKNPSLALAILMALPSPPPGLVTLNHPYVLQEEEQSYDLSYFFPFQDPAGFDVTSVDGLAWDGYELPGGSFPPATGALELAAFAPMYADQYPCADYWNPPLGGLGHGLDLPFADHPPSCFPAEGGFSSSVIDLDGNLKRIDHGAPGQPPGVPCFAGAQQGAGINVPPLQFVNHGRDQQIRTHAPMHPPTLDTYGSVDECMGQPSTDETPPSSPDMPSTPLRIHPGVYELAGPAGPPPLLPRDDRPATPPPRRRGNERTCAVRCRLLA
ncbi:hypothetical protein GQ53DRAFT_340076 [Thozetella sp. PMI_491]|nr:hypothetical protein GQ53DRAFT_340076 [Thozetella sp. PMI_491]